DADAVAWPVMLRLTPSVRPLASPSTPIVRATGRNEPPVQRLTLIDEETGEEVRPLTVQDLADGLRARLRRRLLALPAVMRHPKAAVSVARPTVSSSPRPTSDRSRRARQWWRRPRSPTSPPVTAPSPRPAPNRSATRSGVPSGSRRTARKPASHG